MTKISSPCSSPYWSRVTSGWLSRCRAAAACRSARGSSEARMADPKVDDIGGDTGLCGLELCGLECGLELCGLELCVHHLFVGARML
jgi:hypothetical protein